MSIDREPIWVALFAKLSGALGSTFTTMGRRHVMPPDLNEGQQPAMFLVQGQESRANAPYGTGGVLTLHGFLVIYFLAPVANETPGQENSLAATTMNSYLKAIDDALAPDVNGRQTLGGLVSHCWIEGNTDQDPGVLGAQAMALVPIHIKCP